MKFRMRSSLSPLALLALAGCAGTASVDSTQAPSPIDAEPHLTHALPRGGASVASIQTMPNATCTLRGASEAPNPSERMTVYSDDDGIARVHLRRSDPAINRAALALDCKDDEG